MKPPEQLSHPARAALSEALSDDIRQHGAVAVIDSPAAAAEGEEQRRYFSDTLPPGELAQFANNVSIQLSSRAYLPAKVFVPNMGTVEHFVPRPNLRRRVRAWAYSGAVAIMGTAGFSGFAVAIGDAGPFGAVVGVCAAASTIIGAASHPIFAPRMQNLQVIDYAHQRREAITTATDETSISFGNTLHSFPVPHKQAEVHADRYAELSRWAPVSEYAAGRGFRFTSGKQPAAAAMAEVCPAVLIEALLEQDPDPTDLWRGGLSEKARELAAICDKIDGGERRLEQLQQMISLTAIGHPEIAELNEQLDGLRLEALEAAAQALECAKQRDDDRMREKAIEASLQLLDNLGNDEAAAAHPLAHHFAQFGLLIARAVEGAGLEPTARQTLLTGAGSFLQRMRPIYTRPADLRFFYEGFCAQFGALPMPEWADVQAGFTGTDAA